MYRLSLSLSFLALSVFANGQNFEIFSPPNDVVLNFEYHHKLIKVNTAYESFVRTGINSYEKFDRTIDYSKITLPIESIDEVQIIEGRLEIKHESVVSISHSDKEVRAYNYPYFGSYTGIFYEDELLEGPRYCSNQIRIFNDTTYVCFDGLLIYYKDKLLDCFNGDIIGSFSYNGNDFGLILDILVTKGYWFALTTNGLFKLEKGNNKIDTLLYTPFLGNPYYSRFADDNFGWHNQYWFELDTNLNTLRILDTLPDVIKYVDVTKTLFVTTEEVIQNRYIFGKRKLFVGDFHSAIMRDSSFILTSNSGIIYFDETKKKLDTIIRAEFNSNSTHISGDTLIAGSTTGLWKINMSKLDKLPFYTRNKNQDGSKLKTIIICSVFYIALGLFYLLFYRKNKKIAKALPPEVSNIKLITEHIDKNIRTITINSLMTTFNLSQNGLYEICQPYTPGELIRNKRIELIKVNLSSKSVKELSEISGFSKAYLQRKVLPQLRK